MMMVTTTLGHSLAGGLGLFAAWPIKKGEIIWQQDEASTQVFWKKQFLAMCTHMSLESILDFIDHSHIKNGNVYYFSDDSMFIKHSKDPNIAFVDDRTKIAIKDIGRGEELFENFHLSYDEEDFSGWQIPREFETKEELLKFLKKKLLLSHSSMDQFSSNRLRDRRKLRCS